MPRSKTCSDANAFLLRIGHQYPGKSRWIPAHIKWLKELKLDDMHREILDEYLSRLEILTEKIERFQNRLEELSQKETYREKIGQLRCVKGIDTTVAVTLHAETSDFDRFPNAIMEIKQLIQRQKIERMMKVHKGMRGLDRYREQLKEYKYHDPYDDWIFRQLADIDNRKNILNTSPQGDFNEAVYEDDLKAK